MSDNSANRMQDVFFYGLYMDPQALAQKAVDARHPRIARVDGYRLRIGHKATLLREEGGVAHGMVYALTHAEINALYRDAGLDDYAAEALLAQVGETSLPVLCCNLIVPPEEDETNPAYREKLLAAMTRLGVPTTEV